MRRTLLPTRPGCCRCRPLRTSRVAPGWRWLAVLLMFAGVGASEAASRSRKGTEAEAAATLAARPAQAPTTFAPVSEGEPLAGIWNDPEFTRRLLGTYGFHPELEPRMSAGEQAVYRDKILPLLRQDPSSAIPVLQAAIATNASPTFEFTLGTVYFQNADLTNAITHFESALARFPDFLRAQRNLGLALVRDGRYGEAIRPLTRTLALGGMDGSILGLLGFAHANQEQHLAAAAAYRQALLFDPDNLEFQLGLVKALVATADYDPALALLNELLAKHPDREAFWTLQANIHVQRNQLAEATVNYEIVRRLGKAGPAELTLLGDLYVSREANDLALEAYLAAARADGGTNLTRALRAADIFASRGAWAECRQLVTGARALAGAAVGGEEGVKLLRLEARIALATDQGADAIRLLERLLEQHPADGPALLMAGDYYKQAGDPERAAFRYDAAAKVEGFEAEALVKHAQLLVEQQRYPQAIELLRRALKIEPRDPVQRYLERVEQIAARVRG